MKLFRRFSGRIDDLPEVAGLTPNPGDDFLVSLARAAEVPFLVSGEPHLTQRTNPMPPVLVPRAFLERLLSRNAAGSSRSDKLT